MNQLQPIWRLGTLGLLAALLSGCGLLFGGDSPTAPPATPERMAPVPTFTLTPVAQTQLTPTPPSTPLPPQPGTQITAPGTVALTTPISVTPTLATPPTTAALTVTAQLIVTTDLVNIRSGPATTFDLLGTATNGTSFPITAKNAQGDWWQICCINNQPGWILGELARVENGEAVAVAADLPAPVAVAPTANATPVPGAPVATAPPAPAVAPFGEGSAGNFDPTAQYQIVHFKVLGLNENNGGIRDSSAQHHIFLTVLDVNGNGVDGAVVRNAVGEKLDVTTGDKGPGKAEITMFWEPYKLYVVSDPAGPVTSQVSNQLGLAFPHLPDIVGKLGGLDYEYATCPTLEVKCQWPIQAVHFSYEITFQKVK